MDQLSIFSLAFTAFAGGVVGVALSKIKHKIRFTKLKKRKEKIEEKMEEIDKKLEEVAASGIERKEEEKDNKEEIRVERIESLSEIEDALKSKAEEVKINEDLLEGIDIYSNIKKEDETNENEAEKLPDIPQLSDMIEDESGNESENVVDVSLRDLKNEEENNSEEELDFDEKDDLLASLEKEITAEEKEEIDLLRDLKGQKFDINELQEEMTVLLQKLKNLRKNRK